MRTRRRYTFFIEEGQRAALGTIKERDGIPESEQIRRAIDAWVRTQAPHEKGTKPRGKRGKRGAE